MKRTRHVVVGVLLAGTLTLTSCGLFRPSYEEAVQHAEAVASDAKQELLDAGLKIVPEEWDWALFDEFSGPHPCETFVDTGKRKAHIKVHAVLTNPDDYPALAKRLSRFIPSPRLREGDELRIYGEDEFATYSVSQDNFANLPPIIGFDILTRCL
jgi:hypothetical protein